MKFQMNISGRDFKFDSAAISAIRYRAANGDSIVNHLAACETPQQAEGTLLRMCFDMLCPTEDRPELLDFAKLARKDKGFLVKALAARDALLRDDPKWHSTGDAGGEEYDEYRVLALLAAAHVDMSLIYELPIMHLVGIAGRCFEAQDPDKTTYHEMDGAEMALMYPR